MTVSEALLNCISAALDGRECALTLAPDDWTALLRLAGEQKLVIDGMTVLPLTSYSFMNVDSNHTLYVTFREK